MNRPFHKSLQVCDAVKWFDPAWADFENKDDILSHLNTQHTVTGFATCENEIEDTTIVILDGNTEVYAKECVSPDTVFSFTGDRLTLN